jgi:LysM repeat protein
MNEPEGAAPAYGRERVCPHCGARVAQKAETCFYCNGSLSATPRRRRAIPWADLILFFFIGALFVAWWLRAPGSASEAQTAPLTPITATAAPTARPTVTPTVPSPTPSPTPTLPPTPTPAPTPIKHKVGAGESLGIIADKYSSTAKEIAEANNLAVNSIIHPGDELIIPGPKPGGAPQPTPTPTGGTLLYSVQAGDTISEIADRFDSRIDWILDANKRKATDMLRPGDRLLIPLSNRTPTPPPTATPTVTPPPSPTSDIVLRPPILLAPPNNAAFAGDSEALLRWASSAVLGKDQWYVVTVQALDSDAAVAPHWTKGTQWRLPAEVREIGKATTRFAWQVQVLTGAPGEPDAQPASPPSETRVFSWTR